MKSTRRQLLAAAAVLIAALIAGGCATHAQYDQQAKSWVGKDINALIRQAGPPTQTYEMPNGNVQYTWVSVGAPIATTNTYGNTTYTQVRQKKCVTTFIVDGNTIVGYQWRGDCRAR